MYLNFNVFNDDIISFETDFLHKKRNCDFEFEFWILKEKFDILITQNVISFWVIKPSYCAFMKTRTSCQGDRIHIFRISYLSST